MAEIQRRAFMKGASLGALAFTVGGSTVMLTTRQARAGNVPFRMLKADEAETIESIGEALVPGARQAGVAHFIDQQVAAPPEEALLQARIMNVKPPFVNLYRAAVKAIEGASDKTYALRFAMLMLAAIPISRMTPCCFRSSGRYPIPKRIACSGERTRVG